MKLEKAAGVSPVEPADLARSLRFYFQHDRKLLESRIRCPLQLPCEKEHSQFVSLLDQLDMKI